ncbi:MAG TPA: hypothetical protein VGF75_03375 [Candidatus Saccharimonadales bacterium]
MSMRRQRMYAQGNGLVGGGLVGGGLVGGFYPKPVRKPGPKLSQEQKDERLRNGYGKMSAEQYRKLFSPDKIAEARRSRAETQNFINNQLILAYDGKTKLPYAERILAIAGARIAAHEAKKEDKKAARAAMTPAEKETEKTKRRQSELRRAVENDFEPTEEGLKAFRRFKKKPLSEEQKAVKREENRDPGVRAARAAYRAARGVAPPIIRGQQA